MAESRSRGKEPAGASAGLLDASTIDSTRATLTGPPVDALHVGSVVDRYIVVERLGAGAMGVAYSAYDPKLDRKVALKLLRHRAGGDPLLRQERLVREAKAIAKLSHPNIVGLFDVGVHLGEVFLAMEYLSGGTLKRWLGAERRPWRDVLKMFIDVGRGLDDAHAAGLIHRDFKSENVLLDKSGVPKIVDFGLVRLAESVEAELANDEIFDDELDSPSTASGSGFEPLTRTGALLGTPAYMAPEQFLGKVADARTDQFAFCVSLYHALYGERPFTGESVAEIAASVMRGLVRPAPADSAVPGWLRKVVLRGLSTAPALRFPSMSALLHALAADPVARRRRWLLASATSLLVVGGVLAGTRIASTKRHEIETQAATHVRQADALLAEAAAKHNESKTLRARAFAAFDGFERDKGEMLWAKALAAAKTADAGYQRGVQRLEAAVALTPRRELKDRIADAFVGYIEMDGRSAAEREASLRQLAPYDEGGARARRLAAPASIRIETNPPGFTARLETYDALTHRSTDAVRQVGRTPVELNLDPGSYRLSFDETATHVGFYYPILVAPGEKVAVSVRVPPRPAVPKGFVYVPEGRFLFGSANEEMRTSFLETIPLHAIKTDQFFVSRFETTVGEWIEFLAALPREERDRRQPRGAAMPSGGSIELKRTPGSERWEILLRPTNRLYRAAEGEPLRYQDRTRRVAQDWRRFPVAGISADDALEFTAWLNRSGRVPGARPCTEHEWERAARGADAREFPHGDELSPEDANFDLTYGRKDGGYGPDEVGSFTASVSPFGINDLVGNVWEMTRSMLDRGQFVVRGGSFYQYRPAQRSSNRQPMGAVTRDHTVGLRVCADVPS